MISEVKSFMHSNRVQLIGKDVTDTKEGRQQEVAQFSKHPIHPLKFPQNVRMVMPDGSMIVGYRVNLIV